MSQQRILVATDFSEGSRTAFELAWALSARLSSQLILVHAWHPTGWITAIDEAQSWVEVARGAAGDRLEAWASDARERGVDVHPRLEEGPASRVLIDLASELDPRLIVMGRRGGAGLAHVLLGSVSERVVRNSSSPVLVVPRGARTTAPERLLVGVDFSSAAREAANLAGSFALDLSAKGGLLLAHARPARDGLWLADGADYDPHSASPFDQSTLEEWARPLHRKVRTATLIVEGSPEIALPLAARTHGCDWIVVGVHGRTALSSLMMGSSTNRLLEMTDRPVLTAPVRTVPVESPD